MSVHDKRIVFENPDGSLSIVIPVALKKDKETDTKYLNRITAKSKPDGAVKKGIILKTELPFSNPSDLTVVEDYVFDEATQVVSKQSVQDKIRFCRDCWRWDGTKVVIDSALESQMRWARARAIRDKLLLLSDGLMARESEQGGPDETALKAYRQSLRSVPQDYTDPKDITWPTKP